jgi:hypothetical protein
MRTRTIVLLVALLLATVLATGAHPSTRSSADLYRLVQTWGVPGSGPGELARPSGIAVGLFGDRVYVADTLNDRVQVFYPSGAVAVAFRAVTPLSVTASATGHWYALEAPLLKIRKFAQMVDVEVASWAGAGGALPPSVFDPTDGAEIAASGTNGLIYGRGFCRDAIQCDHRWDVVTQWDYAGHVTGVWDLHPSERGEYTTALAADRQGNFYVARAKAESNDCDLGFCYQNAQWEWVEKYGSTGQFVARSARVGDFPNVRTSLAVDPNTGAILTNSGRGVFALSANLQTETETGIPSEPASKIVVDCRSNVWVLSPSWGGVSRYAPPRPANSCAKRPVTQLVKSILLAGPRIKTVGTGGAAVIEPIACAQNCRGTLTARTTGASPAVIGRARFRLPAGGGATQIPLNRRGQALVAGAGVLNVSVSAKLAGGTKVAVTHGALKDLSAASIACPSPTQAAGVPFTVEGTITPANSRPGRVQIAFGRNAIGGRDGYLAGQPQIATPLGGGRYRGTLTANALGVWRIQLVSLGDDTHEASHSGSCTVQVAPPSPAPTPAPSPKAPPSAPSPPSPTALPVLAVADASGAEGSSGSSKLEFSVALSSASAKAVTVDYTTHDGTASAGSDYQAASGTVSFGPGETSKQIAVKVNGDTDVEPDETFSVVLSNPVNATVGRAVATGTIRNDDSAAPPPPPPPPPPAALPDLVVQSVDDLSPTVGDPNDCVVTFTIKNRGSAAAGASTARLYVPTGISTVRIANVSTPALAAGESHQESGILSLGCDSIGDVTVTADIDNAVTESDENNNVTHGP